MNSQHDTLFNLDGEVAVVTGAQGKLGPVWTGALLAAGARVAALVFPGAKISEACAALRARYGDRLCFYEADVCERALLEAARARSAAELGVATILVNNAGLEQPPGPARTYRVEDVPARQISEVLEVNTTGAFQAAQVFGAAMCEAGRGSIVNKGSLYVCVLFVVCFFVFFVLVLLFLLLFVFGVLLVVLVFFLCFFFLFWVLFGVC